VVDVRRLGLLKS